jgi:N-sulfoglucosamine sulfohydrolase
MRLVPYAMALVTLAGAGTAPAVAEPSRLNVVLLIADDLGLQCGCYGNPVIKTPNIDALAQSGTRFANAFASVASCSPSRATLLTGLPTHASGQYGLAHADHNVHSFRTIQSVPKLLQKAGYRTGVIAKLHVQPAEIYPWDADLTRIQGRNPIAIAEAARQFMDESGDKPFFLLVGFTDPHRAAKGFANEKQFKGVPAVKYDPKDVIVPYHLPDKPEVREELAEYYQSISRMDHGVGLVLKAIEESKNADKTLVIFLSDNGIPFPGAKTTLYDAGVHLPLIVRSPTQKQHGVVNQAMVSWTNIAPTILEAGGVVSPKELPGRSLLPILSNEKPMGWDTVFGSHQFHEITMYYPVRMVRTRTHKYLLNLAHPLPYPFASDLWGSATWQGILKRNDTMMGQRSRAAFEQRPREELYDLRDDPNELKNLAGDEKHTKVLDVLRAQLRAWQEATRDPWLVKYRHE